MSTMLTLEWCSELCNEWKSADITEKERKKDAVRGEEHHQEALTDFKLAEKVAEDV